MLILKLLLLKTGDFKLWLRVPLAEHIVRKCLKISTLQYVNIFENGVAVKKSHFYKPN